MSRGRAEKAAGLAVVSAPAPTPATTHPAGGDVLGQPTHSDDRDSWCTPSWLTALLPPVDLDPCSNRLSTVHAARTYRLERGQDGLALPWRGTLFVNPPYSDVKPWAAKLLASSDAVGVGFLVNVDPSTAWWSMLTQRLAYGLFFARRIQFTPPPGVKPSTNSKAQVLLMDAAFLAVCSAELLALGSVWGVLRTTGAACAEESR